jgi:hypothetical protein
MRQALNVADAAVSILDFSEEALLAYYAELNKKAATVLSAGVRTVADLAILGEYLDATFDRRLFHSAQLKKAAQLAVFRGIAPLLDKNLKETHAAIASSFALGELHEAAMRELSGPEKGRLPR